jgi:hypothetical protein
MTSIYGEFIVTSKGVPKKKNVMLSGNIARALGATKAPSISRASTPKVEEEKEITNRHQEHR